MSDIQAARLPQQASSQVDAVSRGAEKTGPAQRTAKSRGPQFRWANSSAWEYLLQWLEAANNWEKWRCAGTKTEKGQRKTSKDTKATVLQLIIEYFKENGVLNLSQESIKYQLSALESSYKDARALFGTTGEGVTDEDIQKKIVTLKG